MSNLFEFELEQLFLLSSLLELKNMLCIRSDKKIWTLNTDGLFYSKIDYIVFFNTCCFLIHSFYDLVGWFFKYTFTVEHIEGNKNLISDMLTKPPKSQTLLLLLILMASSSNPAPPERDFQQMTYLLLLKIWFLTTLLTYKKKTNYLTSKTTLFSTMIWLPFVSKT